MTPGKTIALTRWTFVGKIMSLLFNMLSRLVIAFLPIIKARKLRKNGFVCCFSGGGELIFWSCFCFFFFFSSEKLSLKYHKPNPSRPRAKTLQ